MNQGNNNVYREGISSLNNNIQNQSVNMNTINQSIPINANNQNSIPNIYATQSVPRQVNINSINNG